MAADTPAPDRLFAIYPRGRLRNDALASFRLGLRGNPRGNPDTGQPFTETEIATATAPQGRYYIDFDSTDLILQGFQVQALFFAEQARIKRAHHDWLELYHGDLWEVERLPASGGAGPVDAPATVGTVFVGSTTVPDPGATQGTTAGGLSFQVLFTTVTPASGVAKLAVKAINTGTETNLTAGTQINWSNAPPGAPDPATVTADFTGGFPEETDAQYADRLQDTVNRKEGAGNNAQFRAWARAASTAVDTAFVYATAIHAGSVRIVVLQRRGDTPGPNARIASLALLAEVTAWLTPPASPIVPNPPLVVVTSADPQPSDLVMGLVLPTGQVAGYTDLTPWPTLGTTTPETSITTVYSQSHFEVTRGTTVADPPSSTPGLMLWDEALSSWEKLLVQSVTLVGGDVFDVVLSTPASTTLATGQLISPDTERRQSIAEAITSYFDNFGAGELIDLNNDPRSHRAYRYPRTSEREPIRAGSGIESWLRDVLVASLADFQLASISQTLPTVPADPVDEPGLLVPGKMGIYPF